MTLLRCGNGVTPSAACGTHTTNAGFATAVARVKGATTSYEEEATICSDSVRVFVCYSADCIMS